MKTLQKAEKPYIFVEFSRFWARAAPKHFFQLNFFSMEFGKLQIKCRPFFNVNNFSMEKFSRAALDCQGDGRRPGPRLHKTPCDLPGVAQDPLELPTR